MEKDFWLKVWESANIPFHQQEVHPQLIKYINRLNLKPGSCVFVPLCGKSKDMYWLAEQGYRVIGIDLSPIACRDFFAECNINPTVTKRKNYTKYHYDNIELLCGDFFELTRKDLPLIHAVYDCKALIALPPGLRKRYVKQLIACVDPEVRILLFAIESPGEVTGPPFPINIDEIETLYGPNYKVQKIQSEKQGSIPEHLVEKGYTELISTVYLIVSINAFEKRPKH